MNLICKKITVSIDRKKYGYNEAEVIPMLKHFRVNNFKNFKDDLDIDFSDVNGYKFSQDCITNDLIGK